MERKIVLTGVLCVMIGMLCSSAFGVGFLGTPTAELEAGQWSSGYSYMYADMDLEAPKTKWMQERYWNGHVWHSGAGDSKLNVKDVKTQRHYVNFGCGITDRWEVYVQLGLTDVKSKSEWEDFGRAFDTANFDTDLAWGLGTRITLLEQENIRWGTSIQMNWLDTSFDEEVIYVGRASGTGKEYVDLETYDLLIGVGPTVDLGGLKFYGGPFFYYLSGDLEFGETVDYYSGGAHRIDIFKASGDIEANSEFGGFIGVQLDGGEVDLTAEFASTSDGWAAGVGIRRKF